MPPLLALLLAVVLAACPDGYRAGDTLSPTYRPGAPVREVVGRGHVLTGMVRSARDCAPIPGARVELWPEIAGRGHPDSQRATVLSGPDGRYRFQCDPPEHIHMLVSAAGFEPVASNLYTPRAGPPAASTCCSGPRHPDGWRVAGRSGNVWPL